MTNIKKMSLFALTWPIFIEILLHMLMGNADTLMLSQYSDNSVAAVGVANQILSLVIVMFGFIATGTAILVAQNLGAKQKIPASEISLVSLGTNLLLGILLSFVLVFSSKFLLNLMDIPKELFSEANTYLKIVGGFAFVQSILMTVGAILRSYGYTKDAMYITIGMNILHIIGNYLVLYGPLGIPVLGVTGVSFSTSISKCIALLVGMYILYKRVPEVYSLKLLNPFPLHHIKNLLKIGVPSAGEHISYNGSQMVITYFIATLGTEALTAKIYTQNIMMFIYLFSVSISQGSQILIGHMIGKKQIEDAYYRCLKSLRLAVIISLSSAIVFSIFSDSLFNIFTSNTDIISLGGTLILLTIILEPGRSFNLVIISSLRAAGDVKFPVYMGILSMWGISVTLSYLLGIYFGLGLIGIWIAFIADEWLRGILMLWRWRTRIWVNKSFVNQN